MSRSHKPAVESRSYSIDKQLSAGLVLRVSGRINKLMIEKEVVGLHTTLEITTSFIRIDTRASGAGETKADEQGDDNGLCV